MSPERHGGGEALDAEHPGEPGCRLPRPEGAAWEATDVPRQGPRTCSQAPPAAQGTQTPHGTQGSGYRDPEGKGLCHKQGGIGAPRRWKVPWEGTDMVESPPR